VQELIMQAIYGERGVKAGFTSGLCSEHLATAIRHLAEQGAEVIILGCTELPLIAIDVAVGQAVALLDPTEILAARCVALASEFAAVPRHDSGKMPPLA
jgi:aspartate racemase